MLEALLDDDDEDDEDWIPQQVKYTDKGTDLHDAAKKGDLHTLNDLLEAGAPANKTAGVSVVVSLYHHASSGLKL